MRHLLEMYNLVRPYKWRLFIFVFTALGYALFNSLPLLFIRELFSQIFSAYVKTDLRWQMFLTAIGLIGASWLMRVYFIFRREVAQQYLSNIVVRDATNRVIAHILKRPLKTFDRWHSGDLMTRISTDTGKLAVAIHLFAVLVREPLVVVGTISMLIYMNWKLTLIGLVGIPLMLAPIALINRRIRAASKKILDTHSDRANSMVQVFSGIKIVKSFHREEAEIQTLISNNHTIFRHVMKSIRAGSLLRALIEMSHGVGVVGVLFLGGWMVIQQGSLKPEDLMTFIFALGMVSKPVGNMGRANNQVQDTLPAANRLFELLDIDDKLVVAPDAKEVQVAQKTIALKNVTFNYGREIILNNVSMEFEVGKFTAIVGPSGSGKSTVLNLVSRFYDPDEGAVLLDGADLRSFTPDSWLDKIGMVTQEPMLFNTPIEDNIKYGKPDASIEEVYSAARMANIHDTIADLPKGYKTLAGERGAQLSGGQRQRICIARALIRDPSLLILDEATSSLDSTSERVVQEAIAKAQANRTSIAVAHRLSTIVKADRIYVFDKGSVVAFGTHQELLNTCPLYQKLHAAQQSD